MRTVKFNDIVMTVKEMCMQAACDLPLDVKAAISESINREDSAAGKVILKKCLENAEIAAKNRIPLCQDTGFAVFFVELGESLRVEGGLLTSAINEGVRLGYKEGFLRASIVDDPVFSRKNTGDNTPAIIHLSTVPGTALQITLAPKGGGCENSGAVAMLKPSDGVPGIVNFVLQTVKKAGGNPCPPTIVGVGIGGTMEMAALLAKKASIRKIGSINPNQEYANLEKSLLSAINALGIGPQGLGGATTALAVHIETHPCHIASMPVAINLVCHSVRHVTRVL